MGVFTMGRRFHNGAAFLQYKLRVNSKEFQRYIQITILNILSADNNFFSFASQHPAISPPAMNDPQDKVDTTPWQKTFEKQRRLILKREPFI